MLSDDILLARTLFEKISAYPNLEPLTQSLSITTFRYLPTNLDPADPAVADYLNQLNTAILTEIQQGGEAYLSNAVIAGKFCLRVCIVNFRTTLTDIEALLPLVVRTGQHLDQTLRPQALASQNP